MNCIEWLMVKDGKGAGGKSSDKKGSEETWSMGDSDSVDFGPIVESFGFCMVFSLETGFFESLVEDRHDGF